MVTSIALSAANRFACEATSVLRCPWSRSTADREARDAGTREVQRLHRELEAVVLLTEQVLGGDLGLVEGDRRCVGGSLSELVLLLVDGDRVVLGNDERGDPAVAGVLVGLRVD